MRILLTIVCLVASVAARAPEKTPQDHGKTSIFSSILQVPSWGLQKIPFFNIDFFLYTRENPTEGRKLEPKDPQNLRSSGFNSNLPIKIVVHGFMSNHKSNFTLDMKDAFLNKEDVNVILVDWGNAWALYASAANVFVIQVGQKTFELLKALQEQFRFPMSNVHVIGHSLGGHIAGYVGHNVMLKLNQSVARITGLDPAGPLFWTAGPEDRLDSHDADFVDVIHTNAGEFGLDKIIGDVDFYPNGGKVQPGCVRPGVLGRVVSHDAVCSHSRAWELFTESIQYDSSNGFKAYKCGDYDQFKRGECFTCKFDNCGQMGYDVRDRGVYYLDTRNSTPFQGQHLLMNVRVSGNENQFCRSTLEARLLSKGDGPDWKQEIKLSNTKPGGDTNMVVVAPYDVSFADVFMTYKPAAVGCPPQVELQRFTVREDTGNYVYTWCGSQLLKKEVEDNLIPANC